MDIDDCIRQAYASPPRTADEAHAFSQALVDAHSLALSGDNHIAVLIAYLCAMATAERLCAIEKQASRLRTLGLETYHRMIMAEVDASGCAATNSLCEITQREVIAGRMRPDDKLRRMAIVYMATSARCF
jgi:hypothetical protein